MNVKNLALTERPMKFDDVIGQDLIVKNLAAQSKSNKFFQSYLLYGHYGCGKTTTARILAAAINCRNRDEQGNPCGVCPHCLAVKQGCVDMVEIDGASNTGIDNIRQLKETVEYLPTVLDKKVYVIDEVHKLSDAAFNALLKVLEEPPQHVVFILATTDRDKIPATVLSRLAKYEFRRIPTRTLVAHLETVANRNGYTYTHEGLATIARNSDGSVRNAIKMLEIVSELDNGVTEANAALMIGLADEQTIYELLTLLMEKDRLKAFYKVADLMDAGWDPRHLTAEMIGVCSNALLAQERMDLVDASEQYKVLLEEFCKQYDTKRILTVMDFLMTTAKTLRETAGDRNVFANSIVLFANDDRNRLDELEAQVSELKQMLQQLGMGSMPISKHVAESPASNLQENTSDEVNEVTDVPWNADAEMTAKTDMEVHETEISTNEPEVTGCEDADVTSEVPSATNESLNGPQTEQTVAIDPFAIFANFSFSAPITTEPNVTREPESDLLPVTRDTESGDEQPATKAEVDAFLSKVEAEQPVLDNLLTLGFTPATVGEETIFETDEPVFYRMGKAFSDAMGGFPFQIANKAK